MVTASLPKRMVAEGIGTGWLVFAGCGAAIFAPTFAGAGIGILGIALAFGLTVLTMAYAIGHISGCHLNPAVSIGLCLGHRFPARDLLPYIIAQVIGGAIGAGLLYVIAIGRPDFSLAGGFACNGFGEHSPNGYSIVSCLLVEAILTFMFLMIIMGSTSRLAPQGVAPLAIGLGLALINLVGIPVTNCSVNPARSTATAIFVRSWAVQELWLFWLAPIIGGALGGIVFAMLERQPMESPTSPLEKLTQQSEAAANSADRIVSRTPNDQM